MTPLTCRSAKLKFRGIVLPSISFLVLLLCRPVCADRGAYRIGVIAPFSGDAASLGRYLKQGIEFGVESSPKEMREQVQLIFEDDQLQSAKTVSAYQKLKSHDHVDAVIVAGSGSGHAVNSLAEKDGIIAIAVGASDKAVVAGKKFVFTHWVSPEAEAKVLVAEVEKRAFQRIAVIASEQQGAFALEEAMSAVLKDRGIANRIILSKRFTPDTKDFRTVLATIRSERIDGIVSILLPGSLSAFAKQVRDLKITAELFGYELFEDEAEVKASDGALIGKWYVNADVAGEGFLKKFEERFKEPPGFGVANSYDAIQLLIRAATEHHGENVRIAEALASVKDYHGACGTYSATGDNRFDLPATLKIVTAEGFKKLGE